MSRWRPRTSRRAPRNARCLAGRLRSAAVPPPAQRGQAFASRMHESLSLGLGVGYFSLDVGARLVSPAVDSVGDRRAYSEWRTRAACRALRHSESARKGLYVVVVVLGLESGLISFIWSGPLGPPAARCGARA